MRGTDTASSNSAGDLDSKGMEEGGAGKTSPPQLLAEAAEQEVCQWVCQSVDVSLGVSVWVCQFGCVSVGVSVWVCVSL